jgi:hypothetical protein
MFAKIKEKIKFAIEYIKFFIELVKEFLDTADKEDMLAETSMYFTIFALSDLMWMYAFGAEFTVMKSMITLALSLLVASFYVFIKGFREWLIGEPYEEVYNA